MSDTDPTDHALATIASILDNPEPTVVVRETEIIRETEIVVAGRQASVDGDEETDEPHLIDEQPLAPEPTDAEGYSKVGPGPMVAIRLKWTVKRGDDGEFYVHETIGEQSAPVVTGPLSGEAAVRFVDTQEDEARRRFEVLRSEIAGRSTLAGDEHRGEA